MPRKLGQHFLNDQGALRRIAAALPLDENSHVVEIGPGRGALTAALLATGASVTAVELDPYLLSWLRENLPHERLELVAGDALTVDLAALSRPDRPSFLAGNLPYYITSPLVRRALEARAAFRQAVFLVQKEVAERIVARKGSRDYGYLSALCRLYAEPELLFSVKPGSFRPPPKVDSAVFRLLLRQDVPAQPETERFLEAAFRQPRKTLRNNLRGLFDDELVSAQPEAGLRAQQLDLEELTALHRRLREQSANALS
ncbi:MAG: ribosomal RNA small subunit methyltransferase A [Acidobacteria bacterium]|nr:ribosomal RNA small subunit methyltransferase A [Acidobacteriota bacterium]